MVAKRRRTGTAGILLGVALFVGGCSGNEPPSYPATPSNTAALDLHTVDWNDVSVPGGACNSQTDIKLSGGSALIVDALHGNPTTAGGIGQKFDKLTAGHVTYGQLETGNQVDAAVELNCSNNSGTASGALLYSVAVFSGASGQLKALGLVTPQHQPANQLPTLLAVNGMSGGKLLVAESWYKDGDPTCCPSGHSLTTWTYAGGSLHAAP